MAFGQRVGEFDPVRDHAIDHYSSGGERDFGGGEQRNGGFGKNGGPPSNGRGVSPKASRASAKLGVGRAAPGSVVSAGAGLGLDYRGSNLRISDSPPLRAPPLGGATPMDRTRVSQLSQSSLQKMQPSQQFADLMSATRGDFPNLRFGATSRGADGGGGDPTSAGDPPRVGRPARGSGPEEVLPRPQETEELGGDTTVPSAEGAALPAPRQEMEAPSVAQQEPPEQQKAIRTDEDQVIVEDDISSSPTAENFTEEPGVPPRIITSNDAVAVDAPRNPVMQLMPVMQSMQSMQSPPDSAPSAPEGGGPHLFYGELAPRRHIPIPLPIEEEEEEARFLAAIYNNKNFATGRSPNGRRRNEPRTFIVSNRSNGGTTSSR